MTALPNFVSAFPPSIRGDLGGIPADLFPTIARQHVDYLDNRISHIERLTNYLRNVETKDHKKDQYVSKVRTALYDPALEPSAYAKWYFDEYFRVRTEVERLCNAILEDKKIFSSESALVDFWNDFHYWNEIDNFHGMFLTSGRWYINFMMPIVRIVIDVILRDVMSKSYSDKQIAQITELVITPQFASESDFDQHHVTGLMENLLPLLGTFDSTFLFLTMADEAALVAPFKSLEEFAADISINSRRWDRLLDLGVFPPFAWHEFHGASSRRRSKPDDSPWERLLDRLETASKDRLVSAHAALSLLKKLELNYHIYNYKGRFGLISKFMYIKTAAFLSPAARGVFWGQILLDAFSDAYQTLSNDLQR